jgi:predicted metal-dependent hydrolase
MTGKCRTATQQYNLILMAQKYRNNIEFDPDVYGRASYDKTQGLSYQNIYKNLMRDIRKNLIDQFEEYKETHKCRFKFRNPAIKDKFFPL